MNRGVRGLSGAVLLGILLMPSPRILFNHARTHRRHVIRKERRRIRREEARARERERLRLALLALDESELTTTQAAADPFDGGDSRMKTPRRRPGRTDRFWNVQDPPRLRPGSDLVSHLRSHLTTARRLPARAVAPVPHFGSGPCHCIPRPREGTTAPLPSPGGVPA